MLRLILPATTAIAAFLYAGTGAAEAPASTLKHLVETGTIRIGYAADDAPFSYIDDSGKVLGYSTDLCVRVADLLGKSLGIETLKIEYVERTPSDRVALLKNGAIDLECVASTNNAERRKSVAFSYSHFVTATQFVSLKSSNLDTISDLAGRTVTSTSGTVNIGQLNTLNRERSLHLAVLPAESHKTALAMVKEGRASAFVMDGILLATMVANSDSPDDYIISNDALGRPEPYGLMLRHDDLEFKAAVNAALSQIYKSGEIDKIYAKWFTSPIPPHGVNLNLPMSEALKDTFANPVDVAD